jgi:hypothetical protein
MFRSKSLQTLDSVNAMATKELNCRKVTKLKVVIQLYKAPSLDLFDEMSECRLKFDFVLANSHWNI